MKRYIPHKEITFTPYEPQQAEGEKATRAPENLYYFHPNHLGTGTLITNAAGEPYQYFVNLPYGETLFEQGGYRYDNPYKFNGKELDQETGLYYYGARYYDPETSIWLSVNPLAMMYPNMNPYNYVMNNPINHIDPTGMFCVDADGNKTPCPEGEMFDDYRNNPNNHIEMLPEVEVTASNSTINTNAIYGGQEEVRQASPNYDYSRVFNWLDYGSKTAFIVGTTADQLGSTKVYETGMYRTYSNEYKSVFTKSGKFRSNNAKWQYGKAKFTKGIIQKAAIAGIAIDIYGAYNYLYNPDAQFVVHPAKAGLNTIMTGIGMYGGAPGATIAIIYFGVDMIIGWDNVGNAIIISINSFDKMDNEFRRVTGKGIF